MITTFLYAKDIELINGVCSKTARQYIKDINAHIGLPQHKFVSLKAFCTYFMADEKHIIAGLKSRYSKDKD
jgi:hypothetical protein